MNTLKIKLNPYKDINIVTINDKPLSSYSELNNYIKEPFLCWASKLLDAAEREINDDYSLIVVSDLFERLFIEGLQNDFDSCKEYISKGFQLDTTITERFDLVRGLAAKYGVIFSADDYKLPLFTNVQLSVDESLVNYTSIENAKLIVSESDEILDHLNECAEGLIVVLLSEKNVVSSIGKENYLWKITDRDLDAVLSSIIDRFVKIPIIEKAASLLNCVEDSMDNEDILNLKLATEIDPFISLSDIQDIEVGETVTVEARSFPEGSKMPQLHMISQNTNIIAVDGMSITALAPGSTSVDFYTAEENIPFARKTIRTFQNNLVKRIDLSLSEDRMGIGRTQKVIIKLFPEDSEDKDEIVLSTDNPDVIIVNQNGELTALKEGKATVTASSKKVSTSEIITVLPNINSIVSSVSQSTLYVGQTQPIDVTIEPSNCFDPSFEWKTSDKFVAIVEKQNDGNSIIRAIGIGKCTLTCVATEGGCSTTCEVSVESTFKKRENTNGMLSLTAILTVVSVFCAAFEAKAVMIPLVIATGVCGVMAVIKNIVDRFWAFLLVAIAVIAALETFEIINIF